MAAPASAPQAQPSPQVAPSGRFRRLAPLVIATGCIIAGSVLGAVALPAVLAKFEKPAEAPEPPTAAKKGNGGIALEPLTIIVNLADERGRRYLKAGVVLEAKDEKAKAEIERRSVEVRDLLNSLMSEKRLQDIDSKEKKELLRREVCLSINERLGLPDAVLRVYFNEFIIE